MKEIKVIFGGCCFLIIVACFIYGIWDFVGLFIDEENERLRTLVSFLSTLLVGFGAKRFEEEWQHLK
jgi:hypothetical protein